MEHVVLGAIPPQTNALSRNSARQLNYHGSAARLGKECGYHPTVRRPSELLLVAPLATPPLLLGVRTQYSQYCTANLSCNPFISRLHLS